MVMRRDEINSWLNNWVSMATSADKQSSSQKPSSLSLLNTDTDNPNTRIAHADATAADVDAFPNNEKWTVRQEVHFIRFLRDRNAHEAIVLYMNHLVRNDRDVYVFTVTILAMSTTTTNSNKNESSSSKQKDLYRYAIRILDKMKQNGIVPLDQTYIALLRCSHGNPMLAKRVLSGEAFLLAWDSRKREREEVGSNNG